MEPMVVVRIHPGQLPAAAGRSLRTRGVGFLKALFKGVRFLSVRSRRAYVLVALRVLADSPGLGAVTEPGSVSEVAAVAADPALPPPVSPATVAQRIVAPEEKPPDSETDAAAVLRRARAAQASFERGRVRYFQRGFGGAPGPCPETVGRFCTWFGEGEWYPLPEAAEIVKMRSRLVATLDSVQQEVPEDHWVRGLRVWYLSEAGRLDEALAAARACPPADDPWFCHALAGLVRHRAGDFPAAERDFALALEAMEPERAMNWRVPRRTVHPDVRRILDDARETADPDSLDRALARLWQLADPLALVPGNDRLTAHYARWTVATARERTRTSFGMGWGSDLAELTVRNGWPESWERVDAIGSIGSPPRVLSHKHPEGRDYLPSAAAMEEPWAAAHDDLRFDLSDPRSMYAPRYAPLLLPMDGQTAFFPRGELFTVVASYFLPPDTTRHAAHDHPKLWLEPGDQLGHPERAGLFAEPLAHRAGETSRSVIAFGKRSGALALDVPAGRYLISVETWSPELRRAGVRRTGHAHTPLPGALTLSDLLLLTGETGEEPATLRDLLPRVRSHAELAPGESLGIAWEVTPPPGPSVVVETSVSGSRLDRGVFRRVGEFLRLLGPRDGLPALSWREVVPGGEPRLRALDLDLSRLESGEYELRLEITAPGFGVAVATRRFAISRRRSGHRPADLLPVRGMASREQSPHGSATPRSGLVRIVRARTLSLNRHT